MGPASSSPKRLRMCRRFLVTGAFVLLAAVAGTVSVLALAGKMVVPGLSERVFPISYADHIALAASKYKIDPYLLAAIARAESNYDTEAVSQAGAVGMMQLMPETAAWVTGLAIWKGSASVDLTNPRDSAELGACYLAYLGQMFEWRSCAVLAAYNAGPGTVVRWVEEAGGLDAFALENVSFPETRRFVERVEHYREIYRKIYKDGFPGKASKDL